MTVARLTYDTSCAVTNLVILAFGKLDEKLRNLMFHFHLAQNRCTIVRDVDVPIRGDQDFVKSCICVSCVLVRVTEMQSCLWDRARS